MRYWWVNQNQTFRQETAGGFLWSPKRSQGNRINPFYEFMREVAVGDVVYAFEGTYIRALGVARSSAYEAPKPEVFGSAGPNWEKIGWRVDVLFQPLLNQIRPAEHMNHLRDLLPSIYAPLQASGRGNQGVYLTSVPMALANALNLLIGPEALQLIDAVRESGQQVPLLDTAVGQAQWEEHLRQQVQEDLSIKETEKEAIVMARRGQGRFKEAVMRISDRCLITGVDRIEHLRASHIRPWRDCENHRQRLDGENGFLLTPSVDHLFDRGFISFESSGELLISPVAHRESLQRMHVETDQVFRVDQRFTEGQKEYLEYHRDYVFLKARVHR